MLFRSDINHKDCYPWCKECVPRYIIERWTSENTEIDDFIKDTIYNAEMSRGRPVFLEWVPFDRFKDIKQIGEGGFAKVYSATWIDGYSHNGRYYKQDGSWKKLDPKPITITLKRLNGSQNISAEYINEVYFKHVFFIIILIKFYYYY